MFSRWFREVHEHPLVGLPVAVVCHVYRCGELCMRKTDIFIMSRGFKFFNQKTLKQE
jgi:hypothetical protein